jgi:hypothetical protein
MKTESASMNASGDPATKSCCASHMNVELPGPAHGSGSSVSIASERVMGASAPGEAGVAGQQLIPDGVSKASEAVVGVPDGGVPDGVPVVKEPSVADSCVPAF